MLHASFGESDGCLPIKRLFSRENPLQRSLFWSILAVVLWRLAAFVISDFAYGFDLRGSDVPWMLLYWVILIFLPGFLAYVLALRLVRILPYTESPNVE